MALYFDRFPVVPYDIAGKRRTNYELMTNIFKRVGFVQRLLGNTSSYYEYIIKDFETPESLAEIVYGNPEAHWIILLTNNIVDPYYDWPMNSRAFDKYIAKKYGSISEAQITYHHHEKVITREESLSGTVTETRFRVNETELTVNLASSLSNVPYDTYENLTDVTDYNAYNMENGTTVTQIISRDRISNYDYEFALNESKRNIKIIKPTYYQQIQLEFENLVRTQRVYTRGFR